MIVSQKLTYLSSDYIGDIMRKILENCLNIDNKIKSLMDLKSLPLAECQFESGRGHQN